MLIWGLVHTVLSFNQPKKDHQILSLALSECRECPSSCVVRPLSVHVIFYPREYSFSRLYKCAGEGNTEMMEYLLTTDDIQCNVNSVNHFVSIFLSQLIIGDAYA